MLQLRNRFLPLLRAGAASTLHSPVRPRACRLYSTTSTTLPTDFSLEDYLVDACGLARTQAREVAKKASREVSRKSTRELEVSSSRLNSASNPDAIIALLSGAGLSRADITAVVSADPLLLRASVKNIAPRLVALRDRVGLSAPQIASFLPVGSRALREGDVVPRLEFFISFYGSFEQVLVAQKRNRSLLTASLEKLIKPNIALLRQWGVRDIVRLCSKVPWVFTFNPERLKEILLRAEELGVPPTLGMFRHAVGVVAGNTKEKVTAKLEFLKRTLGCSESEVLTGHAVGVVAGNTKEKVTAKLEFLKRTLGCSESEVLTAVSKRPDILALSDEILLSKIEFLVSEVAMEPRYVVDRPLLLTQSLEKRLVPRHYVMKVLREKGLLNSNMSFYTFAKLGEETFKLRFIDCHKDSVPGLADAYATACAGTVLPSRV